MKKKNEKKDSTEFLENLKFVIKKKQYDSAKKKERSFKMVFRMNLRDEALRWYQDLEADSIKTEWIRSVCTYRRTTR